MMRMWTRARTIVHGVISSWRLAFATRLVSAVRGYLVATPCVPVRRRSGTDAYVMRLWLWLCRGLLGRTEGEVARAGQDNEWAAPWNAPPMPMQRIFSAQSPSLHPTSPHCSPHPHRARRLESSIPRRQQKPHAPAAYPIIEAKLRPHSRRD